MLETGVVGTPELSTYHTLADLFVRNQLDPAGALDLQILLDGCNGDLGTGPGQVHGQVGIFVLNRISSE